PRGRSPRHPPPADQGPPRRRAADPAPGAHFRRADSPAAHPPPTCQRGRPSRPSDEHMRRDLPGQGVPRTADPVATCHPYAFVADGERHLAPRLNPDVLEFKHHGRVALDLFANTTHHYGLGVRRSELCDRDTGLVDGLSCSLNGILGHPELLEAGNDIAVRA